MSTEKKSTPKKKPAKKDVPAVEVVPEEAVAVKSASKKKPTPKKSPAKKPEPVAPSENFDLVAPTAQESKSKEKRSFDAPTGYKRLLVNLHEDVHDELKIAAIRRKTTVTAIVEGLVKEFLRT